VIMFKRSHDKLVLPVLLCRTSRLLSSEVHIIGLRRQQCDVNLCACCADKLNRVRLFGNHCSLVSLMGRM